MSKIDHTTLYLPGAAETPAATAALANVRVPDWSSAGSTIGLIATRYRRPIASRRSMSALIRKASALGSPNAPVFTAARIMSSVIAMALRAAQNLSSARARRNAAFGTWGFQASGSHRALSRSRRPIDGASCTFFVRQVGMGKPNPAMPLPTVSGSTKYSSPSQ